MFRHALRTAALLCCVFTAAGLPGFTQVPLSAAARHQALAEAEAEKIEKLKIAIDSLSLRLEADRSSGNDPAKLQRQEKWLRDLKVQLQESIRRREQLLIPPATDYDPPPPTVVPGAPEPIVPPVRFRRGQLMRVVASTDSVQMRMSAGEDASAIWSVPSGAASVRVSDDPLEGEWTFVTYEDRAGWMLRRYLQPMGPGAESTNPRRGVRYVVCDTTHDHYLSLRNLPIKGSYELLRISEGEIVTAVGNRRGSWFEVTYRGSRGWVHASYLCLED